MKTRRTQGDGSSATQGDSSSVSNDTKNVLIAYNYMIQ